MSDEWKPEAPEWWREEIWGKRIEPIEQLPFSRYLSIEALLYYVEKLAPAFAQFAEAVFAGFDRVSGLLCTGREKEARKELELHVANFTETHIQTTRALESIRAASISSAEAIRNLDQAMRQEPKRPSKCTLGTGPG
jgi:uncharacterized protein YoaH (UPF0181 family)